jgi:hypothetical protein
MAELHGLGKCRLKKSHEEKYQKDHAGQAKTRFDM